MNLRNILQIPFSIGCITEHPILILGSSYSTLREEVKDWLDNIILSWRFEYVIDDGCYCLWFWDESDRNKFIHYWVKDESNGGMRHHFTKGENNES